MVLAGCRGARVHLQRVLPGQLQLGGAHAGSGGDGRGKEQTTSGGCWLAGSCNLSGCSSPLLVPDIALLLLPLLIVASTVTKIPCRTNGHFVFILGLKARNVHHPAGGPGWNANGRGQRGRQQQ